MTTFTTHDISRLMQNLRKGKSNARNSNVLSGLLKLDPQRTSEPLRALVSYAINSGEVILSNSSGYYLPSSLQDIEDCLDSLEGRAQEICTRRNNILTSWNNRNPTNTSLKPVVTVKP